MQKLALITLTLFYLYGSSLAADSSDGNLFFDTVDVQVVNVEAMVLDKEGQPVLGLGPDDFELLENGEPVDISNFFAVEGSTTARRTGETSDSASVAEPETQNLNLVVVVDNAHVAPQNRNRIFTNLRQFVDRSLKPDDQILIVSVGDSLKLETGFTRDPETVSSVLDRLEKETGPSIRTHATQQQLLRNIQSARLVARSQGFRDNSGELERVRLEAVDYATQVRAFAEERMNRSKATLKAMAGFVSSLSGMKGRKALIYISDGMSMNPADALMQAWQDKFLDWFFRNGFSDDQLNMASISSSNYSLTHDLDQFVQHAASTKVAIYPISPGSLLSRSAASAESHGSFETSGAGGSSRLAGTLEQFSLEESLLRMADETGGTAFTRSANIEGLLDQVRTDFSTFYSLGYQPKVISNERRDLVIKVKNKDWTVRYGKSVREKDPLDNLQDRILSSLFYDLGDNPLNIAMTSMKQEPTSAGTFQVSIMVQIPFEKILLLPEETHHSGRLTLFVVVRDENNQNLSPFRQVEIPLQIPNDQILQVMAQSAGYPLELNMQPGPKRIAIGIRDRLAQLDSTTHLDLNVGSGTDTAQVNSP